MSRQGWEQLENIRRARVRTSASPDMRRVFLGEAPEIRRLRKQLAAIAGAWAEVIPAELAERTRLEGVSRGVLRIGVPDAATAFELDRRLRSGAEGLLLSRAGVALRSIRVSVTSVGFDPPQ